MRIEFEKDNPLLPKLIVADSMVNKLKTPWEDALVVELLEKNISYTVMKTKLMNLWKPNSGMDIMDLGFGFFMVKLDDENDRTKVVEGVPWMIFDHCLA